MPHIPTPVVRAVREPCRSCGGELDAAFSTRGRYAYRCAECRSATATATQAKIAKKTRPSASLESVMKASLPAARRLEQAVAGRRAAKLEAMGAMSEFNSALRSIREAAQRLINESDRPSVLVDERLERQADSE